MQDIIGSYVDRFLKDHQKRKKFISIFVVLAVLVASGVIWQMKLTGISMNADVTCGKEEHKHSEACYEKVLICGKEETEQTEEVETPPVQVHTHTESCYEQREKMVCEQAEHIHAEGCYNEAGELICEVVEHQHGEECKITENVLICELEEKQQPEVVEAKKPEPHVHTAACYENRLVCGKEEHAHTVMCMCDTKADLESAADWEATLPDELKHEWAEDLLAVAKSQLGYKESERNFVLNEDGERTRGYTRYGQWYGNAYGDWCAMYVSWCLNYAEIPEEAVPYAAGCYAWTVELDELELYENPAEYKPTAGDIIFFDYKGTGKSNHVGIVTELEEKENEQFIVHTIEGNSSDKVREKTYELTDKSIIGYGNLAKAKERYDKLNGTISEEEANLSTLNATIYTDETYQTKVENAETGITVTGNLPEGAEVKAYPVTVEIENQVVIASYDISIFLADGTVYEPKEGEKLDVQFVIPKQEEEGNLAVYYVPEEPGVPERMETTVNEEEVSFTAEHFSVYAVARAVDGPTIEVKNETEFKSAFANNNNVTVQLTTDFTVTGAINLANKQVALDLNGHKLTAGGASLFNVPAGAELTIKDSQSKTETTANQGGNVYGNVGTYTESTLTYYVTTSSVRNAPTGATQETLVKHDVPLSGRISAGGATVVNVSGGTVNLESGMLYNGTNRAFNVSGGTLNLKGGYVFGFKKEGAVGSGDANFGGAVLATGGTMNIFGTVLTANKALNGGAIYTKGNNTTVNLTGGVISGNESTRKAGNWGEHSEGGAYRCGGGGIYSNGGTIITMSGGYITNNVAADEGYFDGGGGVTLSDNSSMTLNNGCITGNKAQGGGGVRTDFGKNTSFTMNGGFVSGNTATTAEGGGVTIDRNGTGTFNGGYITNNRILNTVHWGGGGLFCADGSDLFLKKALITDNDAGGFGGGVAGCPTGKIYLYIDDGCAIYNNDDIVDGTIHFVNGGSKNDIDKQYCDAFFQSHGHKDYFCALNSTVTGTMLGNHPANWEGSADGTIVNMDGDDAQTATRVMGLESHPTEEGITSAQENAAVYINGNYSYTHGGGILCNGNLIVGNPTDIEVPARLGLSATKALLDTSGNKESDLSGYNFQFEILDSNNQVVSTATCDQNGNIVFETLAFDQAGTYVYTIREIKDDSKPSINYDTTEYRLTVTVKEEKTQLYEATKTAYLITNTKVEKSDGNGGWKEISNKNYGNGKDNLALSLTGDTDTFVNTTESVSKITVIKKWADNIIGADSVTVDLYQDGVIYSTVELSAANNWTYTWTDLPPGHSYEVREREVRGYIASYETSNSQGERDDYWVPASSLEADKQYMIVSGDGSKALYISQNHQDIGFDSTDTREVEQRTGILTIGNKPYSTWYDAEGIDSRCIFTAEERIENNHKGIILKNNGASRDTWLMLQNNNNNYLKGTVGRGYASNMLFENGLLKGHDGGDWNPTNIRTVIYSNNEFNTSKDTNNAAQLYTLVSGSASDGSTITITNTPKEEEDYELPETGGNGTFWYYIGGLLFVLIPLVYSTRFVSKRRRR